MSARTKGKKKKPARDNFLKMVPKRKARWRRVTEESLKYIAKKENKGFIHHGGKIGPDFIKDAKIVVYGKKDYGRISKAMAGIFGRDDEARVWLDEYGGEVWLQIDGKRTVEAIGKHLEEKFGKDEKLFPRLNTFLNTLIDVNLIEFLKKRQ